ncbi:MAG: aminotransferase class V-fold PLP-dependent enzyme [Spirochaetes bacterium]|nr:aminotransferase class V-fold PLP-dependent enzyme [Spirochaetota bacterium]
MTATLDIWDEVRRDIVGRNASIVTAFGERRVTYADTTASGRAVGFVEDRLRDALALYGNTHTEDDATGTVTSERLRAAVDAIRRHVHAGPDHRVICVGAGATAAVHLLQQILGVYVPPAGRDAFTRLAGDALGAAVFERFAAQMNRRRPVVFVGPYEHHSNEVSWRECFAEVVEVELSADGRLDLRDLEAKLGRAEYRGRQLIGAFSAASNVTGVETPAHEVAALLHDHGALACFDYAASAPYEAIDVDRDPRAFFDAVYFSPHKFVGGPGSAGVLVIHRRIYRADLPPTIGAGGTVEFVNFDGQEYSPDIETRETPGTPGILQTFRAALALELKDRLDPARIGSRERELVARAEEALASHPSIELMGGPGLARGLPIFSFNVRVGASWLHPRFVTTLLNDLFGIQSRAGCSCAAPYGHRLLHIDTQTSDRLQQTIRRGNIGLKPGWTRVTFHFLHTDREVEFIAAAIRFVADHGVKFLPAYRFDVHTGAWRHREAAPVRATFGLTEALRGSVYPAAMDVSEDTLGLLFDGYLAAAGRFADEMARCHAGVQLKTTEKDLVPFVYV